MFTATIIMILICGVALAAVKVVFAETQIKKRTGLYYSSLFFLYYYRFYT